MNQNYVNIIWGLINSIIIGGVFATLVNWWLPKNLNPHPKIDIKLKKENGGICLFFRNIGKSQVKSPILHIFLDEKEKLGTRLELSRLNSFLWKDISKREGIIDWYEIPKEDIKKYKYEIMLRREFLPPKMKYYDKIHFKLIKEPKMKVQIWGENLEPKMVEI